MSRHTDGTYSPATGNRPPGRTDVADNPLTVGLTECADTLRRGSLTDRHRTLPGGCGVNRDKSYRRAQFEKLLSANLGGTLFYSPSVHACPRGICGSVIKSNIHSPSNFEGEDRIGCAVAHPAPPREVLKGDTHVMPARWKRSR